MAVFTLVIILFLFAASYLNLANHIPARRSSQLERSADGFKYLLVAGESDPAFARDLLVTDPDRKLAGFSTNSFDFSAKFLFQ